MTKTQEENQGISPPSLTIDWEAYGACLEASDWDEDQKREFIVTLWSIVVAFVDLGFGVHPAQQACGQKVDPLSDSPPDLLSLIMAEQEDTCRI